MSGRPTAAQVSTWADEVTAVGERIGGRFARSEPRRRALAYIRGLLGDAERLKEAGVPGAVGFATKLVLARRDDRPGGGRPNQKATRKPVIIA